MHNFQFYPGLILACCCKMTSIPEHHISFLRQSLPSSFWKKILLISLSVLNSKCGCCQSPVQVHHHVPVQSAQMCRIQWLSFHRFPGQSYLLHQRKLRLSELLLFWGYPQRSSSKQIQKRIFQSLQGEPLLLSLISSYNIITFPFFLTYFSILLFPIPISAKYLLQYLHLQSDFQCPVAWLQLLFL